MRRRRATLCTHGGTRIAVADMLAEGSAAPRETAALRRLSSAYQRVLDEVTRCLRARRSRLWALACGFDLAAAVCDDARMGILDHIGVNVTDYARSKAFYEKALAPLGITAAMEFGKACGFGRGGKPEFWIGEGATTFQTAAQLASITPVHVSFIARNRAEVEAFHAAAIAAGAKDHGAPGPRPEYHPHYYGAFVLDPDGHNVEAVIHDHA